MQTQYLLLVLGAHVFLFEHLCISQVVSYSPCILYYISKQYPNKKTMERCNLLFYYIIYVLSFVHYFISCKVKGNDC